MDRDLVEIRKNRVARAAQLPSNDGALLKFLLIRLSRGSIAQFNILEICKKQGYTPSDIRAALELMDTGEVVDYFIDDDKVKIKLTDSGRGIAEEVGE